MVGLDDFELLKVIGSGRFAKVIQVIHKPSGQIMALKSIKLNKIKNQKHVCYVNNERNILLQVKHQFIVKVHYCFKNDRKLFFALEYCPGGELFNILLKSQCFTEPQAMFYCSQVVLAMQYLHENNIIYRDLKPENIIIDEYGYIKLTDFGLSKINQNEAQSLSGTPEYLSPEILRNKGRHNRSFDWWTLGCFMYELIQGYPPFQDQNVSQLYKKIQYQSPEYPGKFSEGLKTLLNGLLDKDPTKRFTYEQIRASEWWQVDWERIRDRKVQACFKPVLKNSKDIQNFDKEFTNQIVESHDDFQNSRFPEFENFDFSGSQK